jgi:phosphonate transport system substrate-binding protein
MLGVMRLLLLAFLLAACARPPQVALAPPFRPELEGGEVRVVVAGMRSPLEAEPYRVLARGMGEVLGVRVEVFGRRTYAGVLEALRRGEAEVGFLCSLAAGLGVEEGFLEVILASQPKTPYRSLIVVREESPYRYLSELFGRPFAFTDPLSNTGHAWPRLAARGLGKGFFAQAFFTYGHDRALWAVKEGLAEGAAVDAVVYEALGLPGLRVLWRGPVDPAPPVVVRKDLAPGAKARLREALLAFAATQEGLEALKVLYLEGFAPAEGEAYRQVYFRAKGVLP